MEINFLFGAFPNVQRASSENSGHIEGSLQLHCYCWVSTLIKYSSFLGVKNVRGIPKIMKIKVAGINSPLNGMEINFQEINATYKLYLCKVLKFTLISCSLIFYNNGI